MSHTIPRYRRVEQVKTTVLVDDDHSVITNIYSKRRRLTIFITDERKTVIHGFVDNQLEKSRFSSWDDAMRWLINAERNATP